MINNKSLRHFAWLRVKSLDRIRQYIKEYGEGTDLVIPKEELYGYRREIHANREWLKLNHVTFADIEKLREAKNE